MKKKNTHIYNKAVMMMTFGNRADQFLSKLMRSYDRFFYDLVIIVVISIFVMMLELGCYFDHKIVTYNKRNINGFKYGK